MSKKRRICVGLIANELAAMDEESDSEAIERINEKRRSVHSVYKNRDNEGVFNLLFKKHLLDDEVKFKAYLRLTRNQFYTVLELIEDDLIVTPCNRVKQPITPAEKLALTLR